MRVVEFYPEKQGRPYSPQGTSLDGRGLGIPAYSIRGIQLAGEFSKTSKTDDYTAGDEMVILADASGGTIVITLPAAATNSSKVYWIKNAGETGIVTIEPNSSTELIDDETQIDLTLQGQYVMIICSGTVVVNSYWHILGGINMKLEEILREILYELKEHKDKLEDIKESTSNLDN